MVTIQLIDKDNREMLGSDGTMRVDGRYSIDSIKWCVRDRNNRFVKNFPHKRAVAFIYKNRKVTL